MDVFIPDREAGRVLDLMHQLQALGIGGRDAAYLASVEPFRSPDPCVRDNYLAEFRFMVRREHRAAAARLVGLSSWEDLPA